MVEWFSVCPLYLPFTGLPVLVFGYLYQLLPVNGAPIYYSTDNIKNYLKFYLKLLLSRFLAKIDPIYPKHAGHICDEKNPVVIL